MAAKKKLTEEQVKEIRRRVRKGERLTDLAKEFGVNRKTIRRRLDDLERAEAERAERAAADRLRRQAVRERRKLRERDKNQRPAKKDAGRNTERSRAKESARSHDSYREWLDTRKNLSGPALAEARGLVCVRNLDGTIRAWVERSAVDDMLDEGWTLA